MRKESGTLTIENRRIRPDRALGLPCDVMFLHLRTSGIELSRGPKGRLAIATTVRSRYRCFQVIKEVRRTGMNSCRPFGPQLFLLGDSDPDLTVGAITWRRFAPLLDQSTPRSLLTLPITRLKPGVNENIDFPQIKTYQIHQQIHPGTLTPR